MQRNAPFHSSPTTDAFAEIFFLRANENPGKSSLLTEIGSPANRDESQWTAASSQVMLIEMFTSAGNSERKNKICKFLTAIYP